MPAKPADCEKRAGSFEMWCDRRILKIPWTDFINNTTVVLRMEKMEKKSTILVDNIRKRKMKYLAHKIRENGIFMLAIQGKIQEKLN